MAPTPSKLAKLTLHSTACQLTCAACLKRVSCVKNATGERVPDRDGSRRITAYLSDLALIRWQVSWDYTQTPATCVDPMRICTSCRLALLTGRNRPLVKLRRPMRCHSQHVWRRGECTICDAAFSAGRVKKSQRGRPSLTSSTDAPKPGFVTICSQCFAEKTRGKNMNAEALPLF